MTLPHSKELVQIQLAETRIFLFRMIHCTVKRRFRLDSRHVTGATFYLHIFWETDLMPTQKLIKTRIKQTF